MRIFLSFPSELESQADSIAQSLRNCDYDVFFSHDDLPPGDSFDARVEKAIENSDFMVFLISPASVTKGRYTLTEMAFARSKWPNPSNRVLPVMIVPTAIDLIPNYLKAVTILEPEGNAAAETRAAVDRLLQVAKERKLDFPILAFVALGIISALVCDLAVTYAPDVLQYSFVFTGADRITMLPGVIFGLAVAVSSYVFGLKDKFQLILVVVVTTLGWIAAYDASAVTLRTLSEYSRPADAAADSAQDRPAVADAARETLANKPAIGYFIGCVGGAVGGAITILGILLTNPGFRRIDSVVMCWITATATGAIYGFVILLPGSLPWLVLFAVWQTAFILTMARGFPRGSVQIPDWLARVRLRPAL